MALPGVYTVYEKGFREAIDLAFEYGFSSVQIETAMPESSLRNTMLKLGR